VKKKNGESPTVVKKGSQVFIIIALWLFTAWLFYPLFTLNAIQIANAKLYLFRAAIGIAIMLILFGKTIFDLFFPQSSSEGKSLVNTIFLVLYSFIIAGGIILMVARMIVLYIRSIDIGASF
jgi:hypothetical protein